MQSSKATAHHIKQVAGDPQAAQINLPQAAVHRAPSRKIQEEVLCQTKTIKLQESWK